MPRGPIPRGREAASAGGGAEGGAQPRTGAGHRGEEVVADLVAEGGPPDRAGEEVAGQEDGRDRRRDEAGPDRQLEVRELRGLPAAGERQPLGAGEVDGRVVAGVGPAGGG